MDFSSNFPLGREYLPGNFAVLLTSTLTASWDEFAERHISISNEPVRDASGNIEDCPLCLDCLDPENSDGHWPTKVPQYDAQSLKNDKCQHTFHLGCFFHIMHDRQTCPMCQMPFVNTPEEIADAVWMKEALGCMDAGDCETTVQLTELPIQIHTPSVGACCLLAAHHLRIEGIAGATPEDEQQYAPNGVGDHVDGRRIVECLLQAIGQRHGGLCRLQDFTEQLPSRAATVLRVQHPGIVYTHAMWRFVRDVARVGLIYYAQTRLEWSRD